MFWMQQRAGEGRPRIVVVGRSNAAKSSALLAALITDLRNAGHPVARFESMHTRPVRWLEDKSAKLVEVCRKRHPRAVPPKKMVKLAVLLVHPTLWSYFLMRAAGKQPPARDVRNQLPGTVVELRRFIRSQGDGPVFVLSHSAGGIASSLAQSEDAVAGVICFGYPFRHPDHPEEPYRTAHLPGLAKPFLIIQGNRDMYGSADDARRYALSAGTVVVSVASGHDYDELDPTDYQRCWELVRDFVGGR